MLLKTKEANGFMGRRQLLRYGLLLLLLTAFANAKLKIGTLRSPSCFEPIGKFAFETQPGESQDGRFHARIQFRQGDYRDLHLVTYSQDEWRKIYKSTMTCAERLDFARFKQRSLDHKAIAVYDDYMRTVGLMKSLDDSFCTDGTIHFEQYYFISDPDVNWYYVALINVNPAKCTKTIGVRCQGPLMNISYRLNFRNLNYAGQLDALPANKIGLVYITMINLVASLILVIIGVIVGCKLKNVNEYHYIVEAPSIKRKMVTSKKLLQSNEVVELFKLPHESLVSKPKYVKNKCHVTVKGLLASIICYFTANMFWFMHYMVIAGNGLELEVENFFTGGKIKILYVLGEVCWLLSDFLMASLGIVLAKGWTLVRRKLSVRSRAIYGVLLSIYIFMGAGAIFWNSEYGPIAITLGALSCRVA